jgi:flagellar hook-length control protein FliK
MPEVNNAAAQQLLVSPPPARGAAPQGKTPDTDPGRQTQDGFSRVLERKLDKTPQHSARTADSRAAEGRPSARSEKATRDEAPSAESVAPADQQQRAEADTTEAQPAAADTPAAPATPQLHRTKLDAILAAIRQEDGADDEAGLAAVPAVLAALLPGQQNAADHVAIKSAAELPAAASSVAQLLHGAGTAATDTAQGGQAGATAPQLEADSDIAALPSEDAAGSDDGGDGAAPAKDFARTLLDAQHGKAVAPNAEQSLQNSNGVPSGNATHATAQQAQLMAAFGLEGQTRGATSPLQMHVPTPASHPAWPTEVGNRVSLMLGQHENTAELILTPPHLGKVEVKITTHGDQTSAQFVAATPAAREMLEQALPRLREVLEQAGISLTDAGVSTSGGQDRPQGEGGGSQRRSGAASGLPATEISGAWMRRQDGLVDTFA